MMWTEKADSAADAGAAAAAAADDDDDDASRRRRRRCCRRYSQRQETSPNPQIIPEVGMDAGDAGWARQVTIRRQNIF